MQVSVMCDLDVILLERMNIYIIFLGTAAVLGFELRLEI